MRIIAGTYRGRPLSSVGKGDRRVHLRPTSDRVRESLFSVLSSLDVVKDARVLDLFAGTGALGLEALSRGAACVTFVDSGRVAQELLRGNVELLGCDDRTRIVRSDVLRMGPSRTDPFDLVFLDPPYGKGLGARALETAGNGGWIAQAATVVWEENAPMPAPSGFQVLDTRKYGDTHITVMTNQVA